MAQYQQPLPEGPNALVDEFEVPPHEKLSQDGSDLKPSPEPTDDGKKKDEGGIGDYFRIFLYADTLDRCLYAIAILGSIVTGAALPLMTIVFGQSTSTFNSQSAGSQADFRSNINHLVLYFVYLFVARFVIGYAATTCICIAATRTTRALRKAFLESTLRQEVWHFDNLANGSAATQVTTNGNRVNQGIAEKLSTIIQGISLFFSSYVVALVIQWKLALIIMSTIPLLVLLTAGCIAIDAKNEGRILRIYSRGAVLAQDAISSIKTIHAFGAQNKIVKKYDQYLADAHKLGDRKSPIFGVLFSSQTFLLMSGTSLAFWEGCRMWRSGEIPNVGTVFTVVLSVSLGATSVMLIAPQLQSITNASSAAAELFSIIDKKSLLDPLAETGIQPTSCTGQLEVRDLCFAYPSRPSAQVLHNLNLSIPAGKTTALVGASGCGKSTTIGLLERWYLPTSGQILLDGVDVSEYNVKWLRSNIRLVQQEPVLFQGTVYQNVIKGLVGEQQNLADDKKMELVKEACKASNAHNFIEELPEGYHTQVGERASMLSGGQRQRVAIARSIISDPKVLLLDEATSALDPTAERVVQDALDHVSVNKTTLIIAHKLATIKAADNIAVMANGVVVEQGSHKDLVERDGRYAAMVRAQDLGGEAGNLDDTKKLEEQKELPDGHLGLQRTQTTGTSAVSEREIEHLVAGTVNFGLLKCLYIMLKEHTDLIPWYSVMIVGCIIGGGSYPAQAIIFSRLINVFTLQGVEAQSQADFWALMFFALALANLIAFFAIGWACNAMGQVITHRYRREMMERVVNFDQDFFDRQENSSGSITSKLSSVPSSLQELISGTIGLMIIVVINIVASSALGIAYGWKLGLTITFGGLPILIGSGWVRIRFEQKLEESSGDRFSESAGLATEAVTSIRTISSLTLESQILQEYAEAVDDIVAKSVRSLVVTLVPYAFSQSADFLIMGLGFWYGSVLIASGEYSVNQFFVVFIAIVFGGQAAGQFFGYSTSITKAKVAANYILWLRTVKATIAQTDENFDKGPSGDGPVGLENVDFRYKQRDASKVLRGVSMRIDPGRYAAFVGPSGCGKSTIISLLERFYDPTSGRIMLNGDDVAAMNPLRYRRHMSLVQQEPPLYQGSVRENIALGLDYEPSDEETREACRQSNALEFVSSLPEGLETDCGSKGLQFSGGQRQRIAVARALIRKPRLLLLDEATSALDTQSERVVQKALDEAASSRTTIAVAHRLSTIRHADVIFVISQGKIAEMGTHEELQRQRGIYFAMCLAQSLDQA